MTTTNGVDQAPHRWQFFRSGGFDHVRLESAADLLALDQLDQKLWAALSCPTRDLEIDPRTLALIDTDGDGSIRVPEVLAAVRWACGLLRNPADLLLGRDVLPLAAIAVATPEGEQLHASARQVLVNLEKGDQDCIGTDDIADPTRIFAGTRFNGDGVVPPSAADDTAIVAAIEDVMRCAGAAPDRSGMPGVTQEIVERFFTAARAYAEWWARAESDAGILPLGVDTAAAAAAVAAVEAKVEDYFTRCRLAAMDARAADLLNPPGAEYEALADKNLSAANAELAAFPLARIAADSDLPLADGLNPAWAEAIANLQQEAINPLLGARTSLSAADWAALRERLAAYRDWLAEQPAPLVEPLGLARVRELTSGDFQGTISGLIASDLAVQAQADCIADVERLVRYYRDLGTLLNNFVSFRDFYSPDRKAIFQAGSLYLDGRACELCVHVHDPAKHATLAGLSSTYLVYCDCVRRDGDGRMGIAAAFTDGDADNLMVGRNGVFYDRQGRDWNATITKIVEHPISVREAFWSPYRRIGRLFGQQIEKFAAARDQAVDQGATAGIAGTAGVVQSGAVAAQPFDIAKFAGIFAAVGLALGALGTALAAVVTGFLGLLWWQMPVAFAGLLLVVSGPSMVIAYLKLRRRNLAPILDANGWAVNTRARINLPLGQSLTELARLPPGARRSLSDPYAEKRRPWKLLLLMLAILIAAVVLWRDGYVERWWHSLPRQPAAGTPAEPAPAAPPEGGAK